MKVGLAIYGDLCGRSGGYFYDRMLVEHLEGRGDRVEVVSLPGGCGGASLLSNADPRLSRRLAGLDVDVLVEDELCHHALCLLNSRLRARAPFPLVGLVHNLACRAWAARGKAHRHEVFERRFLSTLDGFIFNSYDTRASVEALAPHARGVVARPGRDHVAPREIDRDMTGPLRVIYVGNLLPQKGLDVLLRAVAALPRGRVTVDVVGPAPDPSFWGLVSSLVDAGGLGGEVRFHGWVGGRERDTLMDRAHLLAVPSLHEGYGLVFVEAMACGLPAIAPTSGGAGEIITHGREGFLVDPGDHASITGHLSDADGDRVALRRMSHRARRRFEALPTWGEEMSKARDYLRNIVRDRPCRS